jgi:hypothetical protein
MRIKIALPLLALIFATAVPEADAKINKGQCKNRCDSNYQFCMNRSTTKQAKKSCKVDRKNCKGNCQ